MPGVAHLAPTYNYVSSSVSSLIHQVSCDDTKSRRTREGWAMVEHKHSSLCSRAPPPRPCALLLQYIVSPLFGLHA